MNKEDLEQAYLAERLSTRGCAERFGISQSQVMNFLRLFDIPRRTYKENPIPTSKGEHLSVEHREHIARSCVGRPGLKGEKHPNWNGGTRSYRRICLDLYNCRCYMCKKPEKIAKRSNIAIHHVDGDRKNNDITNLVPLCASCHKKIHLMI